MRKVKNWKLFGLVTTVALSMAFISCSDSDDDDVRDVITLETPVYENVSAKYVIEDNSSNISSIELTASGNYIIIYNNTSYYGAKTATVAYEKKILSSAFIRSNTSTRAATSNHISGKFIKISDTEFILEGFGTIVIAGASDNAFSIQVTGQEGDTYTLTAEKSEMMNDSEKTNALCRTWDLSTIRMTVTFNGKRIFDETKSAAEYPQLIKDLNTAMSRFEAEYGDDDEDYGDEEWFDVPSYGYSQCIFTKSGTYMFISTDDQLGISMWRWQNESSGIIRYTHLYSDTGFDSEYANNATISFNGNEMTIEEVNIDEYEDGESFQVESWYNCTEAK